MAWAAGAFGAVAAWVGWMGLSPALGFPSVSPAGIINQTLGAHPRAPVGWATLIGGLVALAAAYLIAASSGALRRRLLSGTLFGLALWLVTGTALMPLMGIFSPDRSSAAALMHMPTASSPVPMRETFMMLHLGILAPVGALIAWLLFGAVLGATSSGLVGRGKAAG